METVVTIRGELILLSEAVKLGDGSYLHAQRDIDRYGHDELTGLFWPLSMLTRAYCGGSSTRCTLHRNTVNVNGYRYHLSYLNEYDIIETEEGDYMNRHDAYYWSSDDGYHSRPENRVQGTLWDYNSGPKEKDLRKGARFGFGVEIEKNAMPAFKFDKEELYDLTGAVMERDGSVSNGFELKTPIYDLFGADTEERLSAFRQYCDITANDNAGGHIGFSVAGKSDEETLNGVRGFLPLIYAMYPSRVRNSYCTGKKTEELIRDREKMQSVNLRGRYIEFRIFPAVWNYETLLFRFRFMQLIAKNFGKSFFVVLTQLITEGTELNKLFRGSVYAEAPKFLRLVQRALDYDRRLGTNRLSAARVRAIDEELQKALQAKAVNVDEALPQAERRPVRQLLPHEILDGE